MCIDHRSVTTPDRRDQVDSGLRSLLAQPAVYDVLQRLMDLTGGRRKFVSQFLRPKPGDRILDIGCGTAEVLKYIPDAKYIGFDPSPNYIEKARERFGNRATFFVGYFARGSLPADQKFDLVTVLAALHHMNDDSVDRLFDCVKPHLAERGRVVTIDPVFAEHQNPVAKWLIRMDRGRHVRREEAYRKLASPHFAVVSSSRREIAFPPYTHCILECSEPSW